MNGTFFDPRPESWQNRLDATVSVMRELSLHSDPMTLQDVYSRRMLELFPIRRLISLSRRGLSAPAVRITRCNLWQENINPWEEPWRLPVLAGGILSRLSHSGEPVIINDFEVEAGDPAATYLAGQRSLMAIPHYDNGEAMNMVIVTRDVPNAFSPEHFPELVWMSNLFGRTTQTARLSQQLQSAFEQAEHEMKVVGQIQQAILPSRLPEIPTLDLAVYYRAVEQAGGDYYDFLPLPKGRWGILIADVSGHGTPAAVLMAITHSLVKTYTGPSSPPGLLLSYINKHLASHYTRRFSSFVTAMYAIYDPDQATLTFANAGHNSARLIRCSDGTRRALGGRRRLPLGISATEEYPEYTVPLVPGDQVIFYTDGITDAENPGGEPFGTDRLDEALADCPVGAEAMLSGVLTSLDQFTEGQPAADDRTLLALKFMAQRQRRDTLPFIGVSERHGSPVG